MPTILLTGMPRSGTTLTCALLNELPDTVALAEPLLLQSPGNRAAAVAEIDCFVARNRESLLAEGKAVTKHVGGQVTDNFVRTPPGNGLRSTAVKREAIAFDKPLSPDFWLFLKHPAEFTALLDELLPRYPVYAVVRNPLAALASWQTVDMPVQRGHMPMLERFRPALKVALAAEPDPLKRQIILLRFQLHTFSRLPAGHVLRYEDITRDPAGTLAALSPHSAGLQRQLAPHDPAKRYPGVDLQRLREALEPLKGLIRRFYPDFE